MRIAETPAKLLVLGVVAMTLGQTCERPEEMIEAWNEPECEKDDDCTLMPSQLTCCGECDPAPPFEAVPSTVLASRLIELDTDCAITTRLCEPLACALVLPTCVAYAICLHGRCEVVESGCDVRVARDAVPAAASSSVD